MDRLATPGCTVGCDYAGTVVSVGPAVTKSWKAGDRISGFTHGANAVQPEDGCFAEYCVAKGDVQMATPDNTSDEEAATFGVGVVTCGQGLYQSLGLPLPGSGSVGVPLLVYGASTATGSLAVQYGVLSGCSVIAVCSEKNFAFVKSLGASAAFDYKDPDCGKKVGLAQPATLFASPNPLTSRHSDPRAHQRQPPVRLRLHFRRRFSRHLLRGNLLARRRRLVPATSQRRAQPLRRDEQVHAGVYSDGRVVHTTRRPPGET